MGREPHQLAQCGDPPLRWTVGAPTMTPFEHRLTWRMSPFAKHFTALCITASGARVHGGG